MAEWYTVRLESGEGRMHSVCSFGAIGHPFSFTWEWREAAQERSLRCFDDPYGIRSLGDLPFTPYVLRELQRSEIEERYEDGWYLSGVGHHELWCAAAVEEAVDAAQEHILWDGSDPTALPRLPVNPDRPMAIPMLDVYFEDDDVWHGYFTRKKQYSKER